MMNIRGLCILESPWDIRSHILQLYLYMFKFLKSSELCIHGDMMANPLRGFFKDQQGGEAGISSCFHPIWDLTTHLAYNFAFQNLRPTNSLNTDIQLQPSSLENSLN